MTFTTPSKHDPDGIDIDNNFEEQEKCEQTYYLDGNVFIKMTNGMWKVIDGNDGLVKTIAPRPDGWEERWNEAFPSGIGASVGVLPDDVKDFIRQELTTLHKADCERFREMIPKKMTMSAANKTRSEAGAGYTIGYNGLIDKLNTALSKMEEETP